MFHGRRLPVAGQKNLFLPASHTLPAGLEYSREQGESEYVTEDSWGLFSSLFPRRKAEAVGLYLQDSIRVADRLFATAGLRFDRHSRTGGALTYRLGPAHIFQAPPPHIRSRLGTGG